jgi:mono/diheme cytochrome c family protein
MDELLKKAAGKIGMPPALAERSAQARAEKEGTSVEAVLREWAGEDAPGGDAPVAVGEAAGSEPAEATETTDAPPAASEPTSPEAPSRPTEVTIDYLVALAADAKRMPPKLVRSSAEARAKNAGVSVESVLASWAGEDLSDLEARAEAGESLPTPDVATGTPTASPAPEAPAQAPVAPATPAAAPPAAAMSMDDLLARVAEVKGMPSALAKRSADARAKKTGEPVEAVLAEWAGLDMAAAGEPGGAPTAPPDAPQAPAPATPAATPAPAGTATMSMDDLLAKVAEVKGMPAALAKRSAEARAKKTGEPVEAVLAEWAGVDVSAVAVAGASATPTPTTVVADAGSSTTPPAVADAPAEDDVEVIDAVEGDSDDASPEDFEAVALRRGGYPTWLAAAFVIIPLLAVAYILVSPNGPDCGTAGQLRIDHATGLAVNCDGSPYGSNVVDYFGQGGAIFTQCAACHGAAGEGGAGPAMANGAVLTTFPAGQCTTQMEWVTLGSAGWPDPTYGATNKPVGGVGLMPSFGATLSEQQIASVVVYERVQFGGEPLDEALKDCQLIEENAAEGDTADATTSATGG